MTTTTETSALEANLAALGERNADIARRIRQTPPPADLVFEQSTQGPPTATLGGLRLASRHRPLDEGHRLAETVDLVEHATIVALGFGLGYHLRFVAEQLQRTGVIIVFEPDIALLRGVLERIDHSQWLRETLVVFLADPADHAGLGRKLAGGESVIAQGVAFLEHPASRNRLTEAGRAFRSTFTDYVANAKTTLMTTLVRAVDTTRNLMHNIDHYVGGDGVADLADAAGGYPAVVVSAGPSLHRNVHLLAEPGVRDGCVIIAVQTTLKPLLEAGIRPHFVTALDYHEISKRFYEDLEPADVEGVTLIVDPKAHPAILDAFPGTIRCCAAGFLDRVLGEMKRDMGNLPAGATVAHLGVYLARHLGCNPIAMIGQDLGFPDGLYYAPGTAIHDVWAPELNPFNTVAMMEWQRIARHRKHLSRVEDIDGKPIFTDAQMVNYLRQFERDFAEYVEDGIKVIDASEGGVAKQHVVTMPLRDVIDRYVDQPLPDLPSACSDLDRGRMERVANALADVLSDIAAIRETSRKTVRVIERMLDDQSDQERMAKHFEKIERYRAEVDQRFKAFELINHLNQLGVFKRVKADRRLHMQSDLEPIERQRLQLERDLANVSWLIDAADEFIAHLNDASRILRGEHVPMRPRPVKVVRDAALDGGEHAPKTTSPRVAALVPVDPERNGLGIERSLAEHYHGRPVIQATLERLGRTPSIESIILIAPRDFDLEALIDRARIDKPVEIERCDRSPFGSEQRAIAAARRWSEASWRGGIAGTSVYDEVLCPTIMQPILERRGLTAALLAAPDWPLIDPSSETGCEAVVQRHLEYPDQLRLVFTQAPPGLCGCVVSASLMAELAERTRLTTIGSLLVYQPHRPQADPIAQDANVQIDHRIRRSLIRASYDSSRRRSVLDAIDEPDAQSTDGHVLIEALERAWERCTTALPQHLIVELTTKRPSHRELRRTPFGPIDRPAMSRKLAERMFEQLSDSDDLVVTFAGLGDPLMHEHFDTIIAMARDAGVHGVHVRTELVADDAVIDRLIAAEPDVISIDLHADRGATYERMMGADRLREVLANMQRLLDHRRHVGGPDNAGGFCLPWIVPRLQRRRETYEDIESFYDRWQHLLGAAVIEAPPPFDPSPAWPADTLTAAVTPSRVMHRELLRRMTILSDGRVPGSELDLAGTESVGDIASAPLTELWRSLAELRREWIRTLDADDPRLRTYGP